MALDLAQNESRKLEKMDDETKKLFQATKLSFCNKTNNDSQTTACLEGIIRDHTAVKRVYNSLPYINSLGLEGPLEWLRAVRSVPNFN